MSTSQVTSQRGGGSKNAGSVPGASHEQQGSAARAAERGHPGASSRPGQVQKDEGAAEAGRAAGPADQPRPAGTDDLPAGRHLDREESWLRVNQPVLELAEDEAIPLLERVRFLAIFASNLDEFFMVRVAGRIRRMSAGLPVESASGLPPTQILENTLELARELATRHAECFRDSMLPALVREGIEILRWKELTQAEQEAMQRLFRERIYPVLTPLVVDPAHPFPYISGLSLSLAVMIADPRTGGATFTRGEVSPPPPPHLPPAPQPFPPVQGII